MLELNRSPGRPDTSPPAMGGSLERPLEPPSASYLAPLHRRWGESGSVPGASVRFHLAPLHRRWGVAWNSHSTQASRPAGHLSTGDGGEPGAVPGAVPGASVRFPSGALPPAMETSLEWSLLFKSINAPFLFGPLRHLWRKNPSSSMPCPRTLRTVLALPLTWQHGFCCFTTNLAGCCPRRGADRE